MSRKERKVLRKKGSKVLRTNKINLTSSTTHSKNDSKLMKFFDNNYKKLLLIPILLLLISFIVIGGFYSTTGDFLSKGVSLKGGIELEVSSAMTITADQLENNLEKSLDDSDVEVNLLSRMGQPTGYVIRASEVSDTELLSAVSENLGDIEGKYSKKQTESSLGESFFKETMVALVFAFLFMGFVVFVYFRTFAPSIAVILSAFSDIIVTVAIVNILGINVSAAGVAAFLMLIGYSVDTDIMLSTKVVKSKEGKVTQRIFNAAKTGLTMTGTTLTAIIVVLLFSQSVVLSQIMSILLIGLIVDILNTWFQTTGILKWYGDKNPQKVIGGR